MNTKVIVCDLDGTLAPSKSALENDMAEVIRQLLKKHRFAVISGGAYPQFKKQFLSHLDCGDEQLKNLYLFPTNGSACYVYDSGLSEWKKLYEENLTKEEEKEIFDGFKLALAESGIDVSNPYGDLIEDRGGQVTFSGRGQEAPLEVKEAWDPHQLKRQKIVNDLKKYLSNFEIRIGGATSIDVTHPGITKAYAIHKIEDILKVKKDDIVFIGDALYPGGNDSSAREADVECIPVSGPKETLKVLKKYI